MAAALWPPLVASALDVILLAAITGALHLDGLADAADGLCGQHGREKALVIMKDSRVGAMGLVAVVCVLFVKTAAVGHIDHARFLALMLVPAYARSAMIVGMRMLPYARGKEGIGSRFFETPIRPMHFKYLALPVFLSLFLGWRGLLLNVVFAVTVVALITCYRKKLGGITGDLLGAMVEILEATLFLVACTGGGP